MIRRVQQTHHYLLTKEDTMTGWEAIGLRDLVLDGEHVRLERLEPRHAEDLSAAGRDASIWAYMPRRPLGNVADACEMIEEARRAAENGAEVPFAIMAKSLGRAVGSTRYLDIRPVDRALEIGWTWLGAEVQRTAVNTECKYLLMRHAFEALGAVRVQLKTDARNLRSQKAIERIGGVREGVLRRNWAMWNGYIRDTVYYSVLDDEWPEVKKRLEHALGRNAEFGMRNTE